MNKYQKDRYYPVIFGCSGRCGVLKYMGVREKGIIGRRNYANLFSLDGDVDFEPYWECELSWIGEAIYVDFPKEDN